MCVIAMLGETEADRLLWIEIQPRLQRKTRIVGTFHLLVTVLLALFFPVWCHFAKTRLGFPPLAIHIALTFPQVFFKKVYFYVYECLVCMCFFVPHECNAYRSQKRVLDSPGTGVTLDSCEL